LGFYVISQIDYTLLSLFIILIVVAMVVMIHFRRKKYKLDLEQKEIRNEFNALSVRSIMSRGEILLSGQADKEAESLYKLKMKEYEIGVRTDKYGAYSVVPSEVFFLVLPFLGVSLYLYYSNNQLDGVSVALLVSFIYFSSKMSSMIWQFIGFIWIVLDTFPDVRKLWDFIDDVPGITNYESGEKFVHGSGEIVLENVGFKYDEKNVLENFNLKIKGGEKVALVGRSGSGKTTIAKLVSGYMNPGNGKVLVDGQDLKEVSLKSYYKYLGYLTQEPMVFDGTIKENLLYSVGEVKKNEKQDLEIRITEALEKAQCDFVFKMKKGVETEIGEKGIRLSGGERQRLAIAKLFLKNPEIIILDEPTSALDSFSEEKISIALEELFKGRTTIIIAHRLQTVKKADRILVIEDGGVVEEGNHENLLKNDGHYAKMLAMQSGF
jgi:ABC-type multidrug transport system fused ATPase/permease subunit